MAVFATPERLYQLFITILKVFEDQYGYSEGDVEISPDSPAAQWVSIDWIFENQPHTGSVEITIAGKEESKYALKITDGLIGDLRYSSNIIGLTDA
ncbi:hypothetical protein BP5796_02890 [Coleophoma crateriformis]|uniref:Uncharacterized protein n=1 Tax=Coleophoma crateriformis TaxID=565419 RepID=A0A3D8SZI4_9HELO|nr:hypothetical protein BP5796_02890 [Coleophoma crateriformis]